MDIEQKAEARHERIPAEEDLNSSDALAEPKRVEEKVLDDEIRTRQQPSSKDLGESFAAAEALSKKALGEQARTFVAQTDSGIYRGEVIGETNLHVVQRLSSRSAVAHMKHLLDAIPGIGTEVSVGYSQSMAAVREVPAREREKELCR